MGVWGQNTNQSANGVVVSGGSFNTQKFSRGKISSKLKAFVFIVFLAAILGGIGYIFTNPDILKRTSLPTVQYNTPDGDTFTLKYYANSFARFASDMPPLQDGAPFEGSPFLVAGNEQKYPVAMSINRTTEQPKACAAEHTAFTVEHNGKQNSVCTPEFSLNDRQPMYLYYFEEAGIRYKVVIIQYFDIFAVLQNEALMTEIEQTIDLRQHHNELKKILSSISL